MIGAGAVSVAEESCNLAWLSKPFGCVSLASTGTSCSVCDVCLRMLFAALFFELGWKSQALGLKDMHLMHILAVVWSLHLISYTRTAVMLLSGKAA